MNKADSKDIDNTNVSNVVSNPQDLNKAENSVPIVSKVTGFSETKVIDIIKLGLTKNSSNTEEYIRDCFFESIIRRVMIKYYNRNLRYPTLTELELLLKTQDKYLEFLNIASYLDKILKRLGFRKSLNSYVELEEYMSKRFGFHEAMTLHRLHERNIVYIDETFIKIGKPETMETDLDYFGVLSSYSKDISGFLVIHAGSRDGFIKHVLHIIYQDEHELLGFNCNYFENWFKTKLLPNLPPNSVLVMDNAFYHRFPKEGTPDESWLKNEITEWLKERDIDIRNNSAFYELLFLCERNKDVESKSTLETLAASAGHEILWLPPHHQELNPFELIWRDVKIHVLRHYFQNIKKMENLLNYLFEEYPIHKWRKCIDYVETLENEYFKTV